MAAWRIQLRGRSYAWPGIQHRILGRDYILGGEKMTQAEWLNSSKEMEQPMEQLMAVVRKMNISGPVTVALNKDGMSWMQYREVGHVYELDVHRNGMISVHCDGECYFSKY